MYELFQFAKTACMPRSVVLHLGDSGRSVNFLNISFYFCQLKIILAMAFLKSQVI